MSDLIARLNALGFNVADTGEAFDKIKELQGQLIKDKPYLEVMEKNAKYIVELEVKLEKAEAKLKKATDRIEELESYTPSQWTQQLSKAREKWQKRAEELEKANETYGIELIARVEELGKLEVKLKLAEDGLEKIKSKRILDKIGMRVVAIATLEQLREE